jgi:hypothetical protein
MMRKSLVSFVALGLFIGAPALMAETTSTQATSTQASSSQQQASNLDAEQMQEMLAGYQEGSEIQGHLAHARTSDGNNVLVIVAPKDLEADAKITAKDSDISDRFQEGGFSSVRVLEGAHLVRADLDPEHFIIALSADLFTRMGNEINAMTGTDSTTTTGQASTTTGTTGAQSGTTTNQTDTQSGTQSGTTMSQTDTQSGTQSGTSSGQIASQPQSGTTTTGQAGQASRALSEPDADRIVSDLKESGLEDAGEFKGRLAKAMTEDGAVVFFLITPKNMESEAEVDVSEVDIRQKLEEAKLQDVEFIEGVKIVRGSLEGDLVFVLAGDLMGEAGQQ